LAEEVDNLLEQAELGTAAGNRRCGVIVSGFEETTEFAFSCSDPTLFLGMTMVTAATLVPASAASSAMQATTIAGDGLRPRMRDFTGRPPRVLGFLACDIA